MAEQAKKRHSPKKKSHRGSHAGGLLGDLEQAHEASHEILDALGIKHPHIPLLSVVEMLDHLKDKHADEAHS